MLTFGNEDDRFSHSKYYMPTVKLEITLYWYISKIFDVLIKKKEEAYEKIVEMSKDNDYRTSNLVDYFSKHYKLMTIGLSKEIELGKPDLRQQINFTGRLERNNGETIFHKNLESIL